VGERRGPSADASASQGEGRVSHARRIGLIALGALALRLLLFWVRGEIIVYDEGYYLLLARSLARRKRLT